MSSTAMSLSAQAGSPTVNWSRFALVGPGTVLAAVAANAVFYFVVGTVVAYNAEFLPLTEPEAAAKSRTHMSEGSTAWTTHAVRSPWRTTWGWTTALRVNRSSG